MANAPFLIPACMGLSLSRVVHHAIFVVLCDPFFCSTRAASILPSDRRISIAFARSGGQGRRFFACGPVSGAHSSRSARVFSIELICSRTRASRAMSRRNSSMLSRSRLHRRDRHHPAVPPLTAQAA
jgi:hypothetical protein